MSTYTQAAPQAYPLPIQASLSGGYGAGVGTQAVEFANLNVVNRLTTSNNVLDDGTGKLTTSNLGSASKVVAAFFEPGLANGNFALLQTGVNGGVGGSSQIAFTNNGSTAANTAGFGLSGQSPVVVVNGAGKLNTPNTILDDGTGLMSIVKTGTASNLIVSAFEASLASGNSVSTQVGIDASNSAQLTFKNNGSQAVDTASFSYANQTAALTVSGSGATLMPSVNVSTNASALNPQPVNIGTGGRLGKSLGGTATLVAGTVTVTPTGIDANSRIFFSPQTNNANTGILAISAIGTNTFTITSSDNADTNKVAWFAC